jgi:hypothetical protein
MLEKCWLRLDMSWLRLDMCWLRLDEMAHCGDVVVMKLEILSLVKLVMMMSHEAGRCAD